MSSRDTISVAVGTLLRRRLCHPARIGPETTKRRQIAAMDQQQAQDGRLQQFAMSVLVTDETDADKTYLARRCGAQMSRARYERVHKLLGVNRTSPARKRARGARRHQRKSAGRGGYPQAHGCDNHVIRTTRTNGSQVEPDSSLLANPNRSVDTACFASHADSGCRRSQRARLCAGLNTRHRAPLRKEPLNGSALALEPKNKFRQAFIQAVPN